MRAPARQCGWCRVAVAPELEKLMLWPQADALDSNDLVPAQHGHRFFMVAIGTTWRFAWAPTTSDAESFIRRAYRISSKTKLKIRRVRMRDLETVAESS